MAWRRIAVAPLLGFVIACAVPASASALATLSGKVYYPIGGICLPPCQAPVPGVTVEVRTSANAIVKTLQTAADGTWSTQVFGSASPGFPYHVFVEGYQATPHYTYLSPANGENDVNGIDGQTTANINFAVRGSTITGGVFHDLDNDGVKDAGEPGVAAATVDVTGPASKQVVTSGSGTYTTGFPVLPSGTYTITASKTDYDPSTPAASASPAVGANATATDYGLHFRTGTISGSTYAETNGVPGRQAEEPPIGGVAITVNGSYDGIPFQTQTQSLSDGTWSLPVFIGTGRTVTETQPAAYADGDEFTSLVGPIPGSDQFTLVSVLNNLDTGPLEFGEIGATISGVTFNDRDAEGIKDGNEPTSANRAIDVTASGFAAAVMSDADGNYIVKGLPAGDVTLTPQATSDALAPIARTVHPGVAETLTGENFGWQFTTLSGSVVNLTTGLPAAGALVTLTGDAAMETTTGPDGVWHFIDLAPGTYAVHAALAGLDPGTSAVGNLGGLADLGAVTGIGAGLGEHGTGYVLGLVAPPPPPSGGGTGTPSGGGGATGGGTGAGAARATKVSIVAAKLLKARKGKLRLGCKLNAGVVKSCSFIVQSAKGKRILARGKATAKKAGAALTVKLKLTRLGKNALRRAKVVRCVAFVTATQGSGPSLTAKKKVRAKGSRR